MNSVYPDEVTGLLRRIRTRRAAHRYKLIEIGLLPHLTEQDRTRLINGCLAEAGAFDQGQGPEGETEKLDQAGLNNLKVLIGGKKHGSRIHSSKDRGQD